MKSLSVLPTFIKNSFLHFSLLEWQNWCEKNHFPKYAASQIYDWIFKKGKKEPKEFSNLSLAIREKLQEEFSWDLMAIESHLVSQDGSEKFLLKTRDNLLLEMVLMPYEKRTTLCLSSQVGCRMACTFCQTGKMGFSRNLSSSEILEQLFLANQKLTGSTITNVVFMGMGEPLDNYDEVVKACSIMVDPKGLGLHRSRVTISTSGLVPEIRKLAKELPLRLAISLHNADDTKRSKIMPINRKYSLKALKEALLEYPCSKKEGITFEYVMIKGENDSLQEAKKLVHFLHGLKAKVNLIPLNLFPGVSIEPSDKERITAFQTYLSSRSIPAPVRYSRGQDISGGCGQLAAKRKEQIALSPIEVRRQNRQSGNS